MKNLSLQILVAMIFLIHSGAISQQEIPVWKKLKYLSESEMNLEVRSADGFVETDPPVGPIRNVAEFDQMQAVLVRYPFGVPVSVMKEIAMDLELITIVASSGQENTVRSIYEANGVNLDNCSFLQAPTNSWWVRDYRPWFVLDGNNKPGIMDFPYNRPRPNDNDIPAAVANYLEIDLYGMNILHTGGNYMTDGLGKSASTDLIIEENQNMNETDINDLFKKYLNIDNYYVMYDPLDDYIKHIDCWGKFLTPNKVIIGQVSESDYRYPDFEAAADFFANTISSYGVPYEVFRVFTPGNNLTTPYTNSVIVNNKVLVPLSGSPWDDEAITAYENALPGYKIVGINYNAWYNTDALHCRSKGVADLGMLYIDHMPVLGLKAYESNINLTADFTAYSGSDIYQDSVFLFYSVNGSDYETNLFEFEAQNNWNATITGLQPLDEVKYYIEITDVSGRKATHPFIGAADPHEFSLNAFVPELIPDADTLYFDSIDKLTTGLQTSIFNNMFSPTQITELIVPENPEFNVEVNDFPVVPYEMGGVETLNFTVSFTEPFPVSGTFIMDSILIKTANFSYPVIFVVDISATNIVTSEHNRTVKVFPNPATDSVLFSVNTPSSKSMTLEIFSSNGMMVYRSFQNELNATYLLWNLKDQEGRKVEPGPYFYHLEAGSETIKGTIIVE